MIGSVDAPPVAGASLSLEFATGGSAGKTGAAGSIANLALTRPSSSAGDGIRMTVSCSIGVLSGPVWAACVLPGITSLITGFVDGGAGRDVLKNKVPVAAASAIKPAPTANKMSPKMANAAGRRNRLPGSGQEFTAPMMLGLFRVFDCVVQESGEFI